MRPPIVPLPERPGRRLHTPAHLRGRGHGTRGLVAVATILGETEGRLTLDPDLLADAARAARFSDDSWREVILVARSGPAALLLPMPDGVRLVGVVSEQEIPPGLTTPVPVVSGVTGARERITEGCLVLLDPARGRVLVEPEAREVAALQRQTHRARFRLGVESVIAITQGGRAVQVQALIRDNADIDAALLAGADALFVTAGAEALAALANEHGGDPLPDLLRLAERFGGGAITLSLTAEMFAPVVLARMAAVSLLSIALHPSELPLPPADVRYELEKVVEQERNADRPAAPFGLAALSPDRHSHEIDAFDQLYFGSEIVADLTPEVLFAIPPVYALFDNPFDDSLTGFAEVVAAGAAGVVVPPTRVEECKDRIRESE
ncbi:MAG: hypothetical protein SFU56_21640 [Capsulimonadales bacterium]|nr:hypothetical protein [Capsulimonadales bacterium]